MIINWPESCPKSNLGQRANLLFSSRYLPNIIRSVIGRFEEVIECSIEASLQLFKLGNFLGPGRRLNNYLLEAQRDGRVRLG